MKKICQNCLIEKGRLPYVDQASDFREIKIENGICNLCQTFQKNFSQQRLHEELQGFLAEKNTGKYDVILALSGGKDSFTALYLAKKELDLNVLAFTYQNGFIPEKVIRQSKKICQKLNVDFVIKERSLQKSLDHYLNCQDYSLSKNFDFCSLCSQNISAYSIKLMKEHDTFRLITGDNCYESISPYVSAIRRYKPFGYKRETITINLPFALRVTKRQQEKILQKIGWKNPKISKYSSNCQIPNLIEKKFIEINGFHSEYGYLQKEIRSGFYTREEGEKFQKKTTSIFFSL